jgi:hypothetical protein
MLSVWLFLKADDDAHQIRTLLAAGASAGAAQLTSEATVGLLLVYGILFLGGFGIARRRYWVMAAGFAAVIGLEMAYYGIVTGDPFYRFEITLMDAKVNDRPPMAGIGVDATGALRVHPLLDPLLLVFGRIDFGLLFFFLVPAAIWLFRRNLRPAPRRVGMAMLLVAVGSFLFSAIVLRHLQLLTRYYSLTAVAASVVVALWLGLGIWPRRRAAFALMLAVIIGVNLFALSLTNKNPRFAERALIDYLATHEGPVAVDPELAARAAILLGWADQSGRITTAPPKPGDFYYYSPRTAGSATIHLPADALPLYQPRDGWTVVWRQEQEKPPAIRALRTLGLDALLPGPIRSRLDGPSPAVAVYRVTDPPA